MADEAPQKAKRKSRTTPWSKLAKEIQAINPSRTTSEIDMQAYQVWFAAACPITSALIEENIESFNELYEQISGRYVQDEGATKEE